MNNDPSNPNDDVALKFLTEGLPSKEGNLVIRAYFVIGSGDPDSAPVATATLMTACTRKMAEMPAELHQLIKEHRVILSQARSLQGGLIQDIRRSTSQIVTELKDETARATTTLNQIIHQSQEHGKESKQTHEEIVCESRKTYDTAKIIRNTLATLSDHLKELQEKLTQQKDSSQKVAEASEKMAAVQEEHKALVKHLAKQSAIQWLLVGEIAGAVLMGVSLSFPPWAGVLIFLTGIGLLQWFSRISWNYISEHFFS